MHLVRESARIPYTRFLTWHQFFRNCFSLINCIDFSSVQEFISTRQLFEFSIVNTLDKFFLIYRLRILYRSEEHTSELQSLMRISYAVFCLKKKTPIKPCNNIQDNLTTYIYM